MTVVPKNAIKNENGQDVVFVVNNSRADRRTVTVGSVMNDEATLTAGVSGDEKIIVNPPPELKDGASIKEKKP